MRKSTPPAIGLIVALLLVPAAVHAQFQENGERTRQSRLPQSPSSYWGILRQTKIGMDEKRGTFTADHPPVVKALQGTTVTISGFIMPLEPGKQVRHFLLSKYTPVCTFCPPGEPNEVVEVTLINSIPFRQSLVNVTGKFELFNNGDAGLFFRLDDAKAS